MKIVFGGAFNPVTNAHILVYKFLKKKLKVEEFIFLPVSNAYTKSELASNYHRLNMLKIATKQFNDVVISDLEINDLNYLGTYQALIRLADKKNSELSFVIGADNLLKMHKWINIEGILSEFKIIVLGRNKLNIEKIISENELLNKFKKSFLIYEQFDVDISSTSFRKTFDKTKLDSEVYQYIIDHNLYRGEKDV